MFEIEFVLAEVAFELPLAKSTLRHLNVYEDRYDLAQNRTAFLIRFLTKNIGPSLGSGRPSRLVFFDHGIELGVCNVVPDYDFTPDISAIRFRTASESPCRVPLSSPRIRRV